MAAIIEEDDGATTKKTTTDAYEYINKDAGVSLGFSFPKDEFEKMKKTAFIGLLQSALADMREEVSNLKK